MFLSAARVRHAARGVLLTLNLPSLRPGMAQGELATGLRRPGVRLWCGFAASHRFGRSLTAQKGLFRSRTQGLPYPMPASGVHGELPKG